MLTLDTHTHVIIHEHEYDKNATHMHDTTSESREYAPWKIEHMHDSGSHTHPIGLFYSFHYHTDNGIIYVTKNINTDAIPIQLPV